MVVDLSETRGVYVEGLGGCWETRDLEFEQVGDVTVVRITPVNSILVVCVVS